MVGQRGGVAVGQGLGRLAVRHPALGPVEHLAARNYNLRPGADDDGWPREWSDLELEAWKTIPNSGNAYMTKANVYRSEAREQLRTALKEYDL